MRTYRLWLQVTMFDTEDGKLTTVEETRLPSTQDYDEAVQQLHMAKKKAEEL